MKKKKPTGKPKSSRHADNRHLRSHHSDLQEPLLGNTRVLESPPGSWGGAALLHHTSGSDGTAAQGSVLPPSEGPLGMSGIQIQKRCGGSPLEKESVLRWSS